MTISPLSYYGRLLCRWLQSLGNVNTPRCLLSLCLRLCLFRLRFLDIWTSIRLASSWRWFFQTHAIGIWTSPLQGSQVSRLSTFNIITPATLRMFAVLTCPNGPEKAERRVTRTSQFTSDKNPEPGLYVSSLEFVAGGLSVSGGV